MSDMVGRAGDYLYLGQAKNNHLMTDGGKHSI